MTSIEEVSKIIIQSILTDHKVLIFGVGGNASTASHFAGELAGKYEQYEDPLPVVCLNDNMSIVTAITNDFGWEHVFSRQVRGLGKTGDVLIGFTVGGSGKYLQKAFKAGRIKNCVNILLTGKSDPVEVVGLVDYSISCGHTDTPRVQEVQLRWVHEISEKVKSSLAKGK